MSPSAINFNGATTRRPGIYATVDATALAQKALETNRVAVLGDFPFLEAATPRTVGSARALRNLLPVDTRLANLAKLLYSPASDDRVLGGPSAVVLVNRQSVGQASLTLTDGAKATLKLLAKVWGAAGNRTSAKVEAGATGKKVTIQRDGLVEVYDDLTSGNVLRLKYTGSELAAVGEDMTAEYAIAAGSGIELKFTQIFTVAAGQSVDYPISGDGDISLAPDAAPGAGETTTIVITGISLAGVPGTSTIIWAEADGAAKTVAADGESGSITSFASISDVEVTKSGGSATADITATGTAVQCKEAQYPTLIDAVTFIDALPSFEAEILEPRFTSLALTKFDALAATTIEGADKHVTANVEFTRAALAKSILVEVERDAAADTALADAAQEPLAGGTEAAADSAATTAALNALRIEDVQIGVAPGVTDLASHKLIRTHCQYMAGKGGGERNWWVGMPGDTSKATALTNVKALNTRHLSAAFESIEIESPVTGGLITLDPSWQAVQMAGIQAGTPVGTPGTWKRPDVVDVVAASTIDLEDDIEELLANGLCFYTKDRLGWKLERTVTTYVTDDNPAFSEMSANESINTSIRDLRNNLLSLIGDPATATTAGNILSRAKSVLRDQVAAKIIKAFDPDSVTVDDLGDTFRLNFAIAPIEPVNFIEIAASVIRIAA